MNKNGGYVASRQFILDPSTDLSRIRELTNCNKTAVVDAYIKDIENRIAIGRKYDDIGYGIVSDNLFDIEALGIGMYAKKYQIVLSFEDHLDYFLNMACGCDMSVVNRIPHYHEISSAFMELKHTDTMDNIQFKALYNLDPKLDNFFLTVERELRSKDTYSGEAFVDQLAYEIVASVLRSVASVQNYIISVFSAAQSQYADVICRSRSFSSLVFTSPTPITEDILLTCDDADDLILKPRCYEKYEYAAKEVLVCDRCRKC